ncbi:MAG: hypothetical protein K5858_04310 [Lachnospiraceae bacterium]|nr:hypothetical protein [Lachnospiraceae bacterium]
MKKLIHVLIVCMIISLCGCGKPKITENNGIGTIEKPGDEEKPVEYSEEDKTGENTDSQPGYENPGSDLVPVVEPEPEEKVIESFRDFFEETDNKGVYSLDLGDTGLSNSELNFVGNKVLYVASDYSDTPAVFRLIDLDTGDIRQKRFAGYSPYSLEYIPINDEEFALFKSFEATLCIYNSRFELQREFVIPGSEEQKEDYSEYEGYYGEYTYSARVTKDGKYAWVSDGRGSLKKYDIETFEELISVEDAKDSYFTNGDYGDEYLVLGRYDSKEDTFMTLLFDEVTGEKVAEFPDRGTACFSPDKKRAVQACSNDGDYKLMLFEDLTGFELPDVASGKAIEINSTEETYNYMVDWDDDVVVTYEYNYSPVGSIAEVNCYSLKTLAKVSNFVINSGNSGFNYCLDAKRNVFLATWFDDDGFSRLYAWDYINDEVENTSKYYKKYTSIPKKLEAKRAEMEEKYNMYIYLGSECYVTDFDYRLERTTDYERMYDVLCDVDEVFSLYPDGFFAQICVGEIRTLGIYLCGGFVKVSDYSADNAIALTMRSGYENTLALDITCDDALIKENVVHEISHWIDSRIDALQERGKFLTYDEEWDALNPKDFKYFYSYVDYNTRWEYIYDSNAKKKNKFYFTDSYSQTYPGEDRARLFEYLVYDNYDQGYMSMPHAREKLGYYFKVIREVFDTTGWPAETTWEEKLRLANEKYEEKDKDKDKEKDKNKD